MLVLNKRTELNSSAPLQDYCCKNGAACIQSVRYLQALAICFGHLKKLSTARVIAFFAST
jgi:hypothetical protein